jgi:hypothetical protein
MSAARLFYALFVAAIVALIFGIPLAMRTDIPKSAGIIERFVAPDLFQLRTVHSPEVVRAVTRRCKVFKPRPASHATWAPISGTSNRRHSMLSQRNVLLVTLSICVIKRL